MMGRVVDRWNDVCISRGLAALLELVNHACASAVGSFGSRHGDGRALCRSQDPRRRQYSGVQELGDELFGLVEQDNRKNLLLNFSNVEFMSSAALNKLIVLNKKVQGVGGKMRLSNLRPEIYDVFVITRLNTVFDIKSDEADALAAFK
jgi:anti-sigma B factor antagonist